MAIDLDVDKIVSKLSDDDAPSLRGAVLFLINQEKKLAVANIGGPVSNEAFFNKNREKVEEFADEDRLVFELLSQLIKKIEHVFRINNFKIRSYIAGVLRPLQTNADLGELSLITAPLSRAVYEIIAVETFLLEELERKWRNTKNQKKYDTAVRHLEGQIRLINKGYQKTNVIKGVEALGRRYNRSEEERSTYDFFCEYVHPNQGTNKLFNEGDLGDGELGPNSNLARTVITVFLLRVEQVLMNRNGQYRDLIGLWLDMKSKRDRFVSGKYTIANILTDKNPKLEKRRDGLSRENAIRFLNADDHQELISFQYQHLSSRNIESSQKRLEKVGGIYFDVHSTAIGEIWFELGDESYFSRVENAVGD